MFDIGFLEMVLVAIVALLVLGPERLPSAVRMAGLYIGRIKRSLADVRSQVEREIGADEIRQALHNEKIMADLAKKPNSPQPGSSKPTSNVRRASQGEAAEQTAPPTQEPPVQSTDAPPAADDAASPVPSSNDDHPAAPK